MLTAPTQAPDAITIEYLPARRAAVLHPARVFSTAPSRLIGHLLRVHLYVTVSSAFLGATAMMTLRRDGVCRALAATSSIIIM